MKYTKHVLMIAVKSSDAESSVQNYVNILSTTFSHKRTSGSHTILHARRHQVLQQTQFSTFWLLVSDIPPLTKINSLVEFDQTGQLTFFTSSLG